MNATGESWGARLGALACLLAIVVGAWLGWKVGVRYELPAIARPASAGYAKGYVAHGLNLCSAGPGRVLHIRACSVFAGWNYDATATGVAADYRFVGRELVHGVPIIFRRWMPAGAALFLALAIALLVVLARDGHWSGGASSGLGGKWIRGRRFVHARTLSRLARRSAGRGDMQLAGVTVPRALEPYHFLLLGSTGQGKSAAFKEMLDGIRDRGDAAIVVDSGGEFLARYGLDEVRGDCILNPIDPRSVPWSPLAEIRTPADARRLACALIPDASGDSAEWHRYAQVLLADVLRRAYAENADNDRIKAMALSTDMATLRTLLANTPTANMAAEGNERMFLSVKAVIVAHIGALGACAGAAGRDAFSIRRWVERGRGWTYFNYLDGYLSTLDILIGAMLDVAAGAVLDLAQNTHRRIWLVLDEVASLGKVQSLPAFLTRGRKHGGCAVLGVQSNAQLRGRYGRDEAQTILSSLSNRLVLEVNDPETADYASRMLGEAQYLRRVQSGGKTSRDSHSGWAQQDRTERVVLPSEIESLPIRRGYLMLTGGLPAARVAVGIPNPRHSGCAPILERAGSAISLAEFAPKPQSGPRPVLKSAGDVPDFVDRKPPRP